jgi:class 3 adenylate cyclase/tetratricopeptide (TPR) repeat protein
MKCTACGHENREGARFCRECAAPLAAAMACPTCGTPSESGQKFCDVCGAALGGRGSRRAAGGEEEGSAGALRQGSGQASPSQPSPVSYTPKHLAEKILQSKSAVEGERKQVTVLFADVKGSMELAEQVDPEEWHKIMDRFFAILTDGVHRFEGTINQYTGDGIMALFGAPIAHEDHAQRACYAALHLTTELRHYADELRLERGLNFSVRMGLNSGEVVVGKIGDDLRMDYTAQGHTVGLAARMEHIAEPGKALLTEHTAKLVEGYFALRDLGASKLHGVSEPIHVHELEGIGMLRTRLEVSRSRGFSRFVGRVDEMQALETALGRAIAGNGQVVGVVADAGVGKSRLCYEFVQRCRARGIPVYEGHCVAYGKAVPLLPILELMRAYFGVTEQDSPRAARDKIAGRLVLLDVSLTDAVPLMLDFLGVPDPERPAPPLEAEARQRQLFDTIRRGMRARSTREPAVSLLEDLHWIDGASEAFVENLVEGASGSRTLFLLNFRREYRAGWMQKSHYHALPLAALGPEAISELLTDLLGTDPSLVGLTELIRTRTGGNPFFTEEVVQSLIESGSLQGTKGAYRLVTPVEQIVVPATVQAVLAARIDRLLEREKRALQAASVIGKTFPQSILKAVAELPERDLVDAVRALQAAEFVYEETLYPEVEYAFKHPLTQEVAYGAQLADRRAQLHAAVAGTIEQLNPAKLDERAALLAYHWECAGDAPQAARWHRRAAEWTGTNDLEEALRHWRKVQSLTEAMPESPETLGQGAYACAQMLWYELRRGMSDENAAALFAKGKVLAERTGNPALQALILNAYGFFKFFSGSMGDALPVLSAAATQANQTADRGLQATVLFGLAMGSDLAGELRASLQYADDGITLTRDNPRLGVEVAGYSPHATLLGISGYTLMYAGQPHEGAARVEREMQLAHEHHQLMPLAVAHSYLVTFAEVTGETRSALEHGRQSVDVAEKTGSQPARVVAYFSLGLAHLLNDQWTEAVSGLEGALTIARDANSGLCWEAVILARLAAAFLGVGEPERARRAAEEALAVARQRGTKLWEHHAQLILAQILMQTQGAGAAAAIGAALSAAQAAIEATGAKSYAPFVHVEHAALARLLGDDETRQHELREAHRLFLEMGATEHAERLAKELGL